MADWRYAPSNDIERVSHLLSWRSFDQILGEMVRTGVVVQPWWEPAKSTLLSGANRASAVVLVPRHVYDAFFNSPVGYRAEYAKSLALGLAANRSLIDLFTCVVVRTFDTENIPTSQAQISASLRAEDAKAWIDESESETQADESSLRIVYEPWERNDPLGLGLYAPVGTRIEIKGGWVDDKGTEIRNPQKVNRSLDIADKGDT